MSSLSNAAHSFALRERIPAVSVESTIATTFILMNKERKKFMPEIRTQKGEEIFSYKPTSKRKKKYDAKSRIITQRPFGIAGKVA